MNAVFVGSEVLGSGGLTRSRLRWNYKSIYPDVYVPNGVAPSLRQHTVGAWLWSGRRGIVAGRAAAAPHGALWVQTGTPIELITPSSRPPRGIITRDELINDDELVLIDGMAVTNPARTAFDLARHLHRDLAVRHLDALARDRYRSSRGACVGRPLSPRTWPGPLCARAGPDGRRRTVPEGDGAAIARHRRGISAPRPVADGINNAFLDMGWDEPMIGLDYEGELHQTLPPIRPRHRAQRVGAESGLARPARRRRAPRAFIVHRLDEEFAQRHCRLRLRPRS